MSGNTDLWLYGQPVREVCCICQSGGEADNTDVALSLAADISHPGDYHLLYGPPAFVTQQLRWHELFSSYLLDSNYFLVAGMSFLIHHMWQVEQRFPAATAGN